MSILYSPVWLRTFVVVAESRSFTAAAERLNLRQSTISDHIRKLEDACARRLFVRDTHSVAITIDGEAMLGFARSILGITERAQRHFAEEVRGRVRFGVSEDVVLHGLPEALRRFTALHPGIELELTVELSETLRDKLKDGDLDLIYLKRKPGERHGDLVLRDPLSWIAAPDFRVDPEKPVPLIVLAPPSLTRLAAFAALEAQGRAWRIVCSSGSQSGIHAAARAGLGVAPHARSLIPADLVEAPPEMRLPSLGDTEFIILTARGARAATVKTLADMILGGGWLLPEAGGAKPFHGR
jgi:DNA-binding transcriptional LysR family regulator